MVNHKVHLKSKNYPYIYLFFMVNIAIYLSATVGSQLTRVSIEQFMKQITLKDSLLSICLPLLTIVLSGILNDLTKARITFWRWHNPLPGCRAFSEITSSDPRIDVKALKVKLGQFPSSPSEQNALWYRLYLKYADALSVTESHKSYLLLRDMTVLSLTFVFLFSFGVITSTVNWTIRTEYIIFLIFQYIILSISGRNYGTRFVQNVLTVASHDNNT